MSKKITIFCNKNELVKVRQFTTDTLENHNLSDMQIYKLVLAIDEVCSNIIIHSNNCKPRNKIEFSVNFMPKQIIFTFKDKGIRFDINQYNPPETEELILARRQGGIGLILVKKIIDEIKYTTENNYNICRLIKQL